MSEKDRKEMIDELADRTKIRRSYFEDLSDERLLQEVDKLKLIY